MSTQETSDLQCTRCGSTRVEGSGRVTCESTGECPDGGEVRDECQWVISLCARCMRRYLRHERSGPPIPEGGVWLEMGPEVRSSLIAEGGLCLGVAGLILNVLLVVLLGPFALIRLALGVPDWERAPLAIFRAAVIATAVACYLPCLLALIWLGARVLVRSLMAQRPTPGLDPAQSFSGREVDRAIEREASRVLRSLEVGKHDFHGPFELPEGASGKESADVRFRLRVDSRSP